MPVHLLRNREAKYPPNADDIIATINRYAPVMLVKVEPETPEPDHGDTTARPNPAPSANSVRESAAATKAPATTLDQEMPDSMPAQTGRSSPTVASITCSPGNTIFCLLKTKRLTKSSFLDAIQMARVSP